LHIAGKMEKLNAIDTTFDLNNRYNIWSGIIGGFFLQLSYFGTDQSQVGRYLTGSSVTQSRLGLVMNGLIKIPMQFFILLIGTLVFAFYQFYEPPVFFNNVELNKINNSIYHDDYVKLEKAYNLVHADKKKEAIALVDAIHLENTSAQLVARERLQDLDEKSTQIKKEVTALMIKNNPKADTNDTNYVFLHFVTKQLPVGIVGLLIAIIFLASMGSTASGLNSLASTVVVDFYKRIFKKNESDKNYLSASRWATVAWGGFCILVALYASKLGNLIEAVNILGSLFYGTILGIFLVAFYLKKVNGTAVFIAALIAESFIVCFWMIDLTAFLWLNVIGCLMVIIIALLIQYLIDNKTKKVA